MNSCRFDRLTKSLGRLNRPLSRRAALLTGSTLALATSQFMQASAQVATPQAIASDDQTVYLFVQSVEGGTFTPIDGTDLYVLELTHAGAATLAFADRPARTVRLLPTTEALDAIGFVPEPPNAALVIGPANAEVIVLELLEGNYSAESGTLVYRVRLLAEADIPTFAGEMDGLTVIAPPERFGHASLFIDDTALDGVEASADEGDQCNLARSYDPSTGLPSLAYHDFSGCDISEIDLSGADLRKAFLNNSFALEINLAGANLEWANLRAASFRAANLINANLSFANLHTTDLLEANLTGAVLDNAIIDNVYWQNTICPDGTNSDYNGNTCVGHL